MKTLNVNLESASLETLTEALKAIANQISLLQETPKNEIEVSQALETAAKFYNGLKLNSQNRIVLRYSESLKKSKK